MKSAWLTLAAIFLSVDCPEAGVRYSGAAGIDRRTGSSQSAHHSKSLRVPSRTKPIVPRKGASIP